MRTIIKSIPNTITLLNLLCGCVSISHAFIGEIDIAMYAIVVAAVLDFFDGFAARMLKAYSDIGKDLDSLADMVSFGVAPSVMLYIASGGNYFAFVLAAFSALRLAKFNNDTRQTSSFIGLPTPANAFFISSGVYVSMLGGEFSHLIAPIFTSTVGSSIISAVFALIMVSEIPMFSLKLKSYKLQDNVAVYSFLVFSIAMLVWLKLSALVIIIPAYIILSAALHTICGGKSR